MPWNEEGSEMEHTCAWVPCTDYPRERERERERERHTHTHTEEYQSIKKYQKEENRGTYA